MKAEDVIISEPGFMAFIVICKKCPEYVENVTGRDDNMYPDDGVCLTFAFEHHAAMARRDHIWIHHRELAAAENI